MAEPVLLDLPFRGRWAARNSPATRVPSHGSDLFGTTYAIDFVAVDARGRSARRRPGLAIAGEPPGEFVGFGAPILAPAAGTVVAALDGEPDHEAHRSILTRLPYLLGQGGRVRRGVAAIAGNHVVIALTDAGPYVLLAHLRHASVRVRPGDALASGEQVGDCGNSGNSTEPHVHVQVTDSTDWTRAHGMPLAFRRPGAAAWVPRDGEVVDAGPAVAPRP